MSRPLTVVVDGADYFIAVEDWPVNYEHMDGPGPYEDDPSDPFDFHYTCGDSYEHSETTGRTFCRCGFWYDRHYWREALA